MPLPTEPDLPASVRWRARLWPAIIALLIVAASHRPRLASPDITHLDKVVHFSVYGLLATLVCRLGSGRKAAIGAWIAVAVFGILDEWHQSFVPGRAPDAADWVADALGAALAVTLYTCWHSYRRVLETPCGRGKRAGKSAP